jgi:hypothetical protein
MKKDPDQAGSGSFLREAARTDGGMARDRAKSKTPDSGVYFGATTFSTVCPWRWPAS